MNFPATTDPAKLVQEMVHDEDHMNVVFATYHSIDVLHQAQQKYGLPPFDFIICDEAHRTTGATFAGEGRKSLC